MKEEYQLSFRVNHYISIKKRSKAVLGRFWLAAFFLFGASPFVSSLMALDGVSVTSLERLGDGTLVHRGDWVVLRAIVENTGSNDLTSFNVDLFKNVTGPEDYTGRSGDLRYVVHALPAGKSIAIDFVFKALGSFDCIAVVEPQKASPGDVDASNRLRVDVEATDLGEDSYENNDTYETAKPITLPADGGINLVSKDDDYFSIEATFGDTIVVDLYDYAPEVSNLDLFLYDFNGNLVASSEGIRERERVVYKIPGGGDVKVKYVVYVKPGKNHETYMLRGRVGAVPELAVTIDLKQPELLIDEVSAEVIVTEVDGRPVPNTRILTDPDNNDRLLLDYHFNNRISVTVENTGEPLPANSLFYVDIFRNNPAAPRQGDFGNAHIHTVSAEDFDGGTQYSFEWVDEFLIPSQYTYYVYVDSDNLVVESNETDNLTGPVQVITDGNTLPKLTSMLTYHYSFLCEITTEDLLPFCGNAPLQGTTEVSWGGLTSSVRTLIINHIRANEIFPDDSFDQLPGWSNDFHPVAIHSLVLIDPTYNNTDYDNYLSGITINSGQYKHNVSLDDDYYIVDVAAREYLEVRLRHNPNYGNLDLSLSTVTDPAAIASNSSMLPTRSLSYYNTSASPKRIVVKVHPLNGTNPDYDLEVVKKAVMPNYELIFDSISLVPGQQEGENHLLFSVKNLGTSNIYSVPVWFYSFSTEQGPDLTQDLADNVFTVNDLAPGAVADFSMTVPRNVDPVYYHLFVDPENALPEKNEQNNHILYTQDSESFSDDYMEQSANGQNDIYQNATSVSAGLYQNLKALDVDYYLYDLPAGGKISISALFEHRLGDIDLRVEELNTVNGITELTTIADSASGSDDEHLEIENNSTQNKLFYISAFPALAGQGTSDNGYSLLIRTMTPASKSDLVIQSLLTNPVQASEGELIRSTVGITNTGASTVFASSNMMVDLYIDYINGNNIPEMYGRYFALLPVDLEPGQVYYFTFEYLLPAGQYRVRAMADTENVVDEMNEGNNGTAAKSVQVVQKSSVDLSPEIISFTKDQANSALWHSRVKVSNKGATQLYGFDYLCLLVDSEGRELFRWSKSRQNVLLNQGDFVELQLSLGIPSDLPAGKYALKVVVDPDNLVNESVEINNIVVSSSLLTFNNTIRSLIFETIRSLDGSSSVDTVVTLYRDDGGQLVEVRRSDDVNGIFSYIKAALAPGTYYVKVQSYSGQTGSYSFYYGSTERTGIEEVDQKPSFQYEKNDRSGTATVPVEFVIQNQAIGTTDDIDWYRIEVK